MGHRNKIAKKDLNLVKEFGGNSEAWHGCERELSEYFKVRTDITVEVGSRANLSTL